MHAKTETIDILTAKSAQLEAMLAVVMATPEAFEALSPGHRAEFLWACHAAASGVRAAADSLTMPS